MAKMIMYDIKRCVEYLPTNKRQKANSAVIAIGYRAAPHEALRKVKTKPAVTAYKSLIFHGFSFSMDLRKKRQKRIRLKIPTLSSSKNPSAVRLIYEESSARNNAANIPTGSPPRSFPRKYIARDAKVAMTVGKITQKT